MKKQQSENEPSTTRLDRSINQHNLNQHQLRMEIDEQHRLGFLNWLPLILVILPNLAPIFFDGEPESWRHSIIFLLIVFFLYKISKAPWQLYASARTTRIFKQLGVTRSTKTIHPAHNGSHQACLTELNRIEIGFLLLAMSSPSIGIGLLIYLQSKLDLGLDYLNSHSTVLFLLASLVKPLGHLHDRVLQRSRYLQSQLEFPTQSAEQFNESFENLAFKLNQLEMESLTKTELMDFKKNQIDLKLMEISNRLSQFEKSDQIYQSNSFDRLSKLERTLAENLEKLEKTELSFHHLRFLNHPHSSPLDSLSKVFAQILHPHHQSEKREDKDNSNDTRAVEHQPNQPNYKLLDQTQDGPSSMTDPAPTTSNKVLKTPQLVQHSLNPDLEIIQHGLERIAYQIFNGIRYPITTFIKVLSCLFTLLASFCLILHPIQILNLMTKTKNVKNSTGRGQIGTIQPIKTLKSINGGGDVHRHQTRHHPARRSQKNHHLRHAGTPPTTPNLDLPNHHSPPPSALSSSSSDHQSPPLQSPPLSSDPFHSSPHQIQQHLHQKVTHHNLPHLDASDPNSLYHLHP